jgi:hypothetical protein
MEDNFTQEWNWYRSVGLSLEEEEEGGGGDNADDM